MIPLKIIFECSPTGIDPRGRTMERLAIQSHSQFENHRAVYQNVPHTPALSADATIRNFFSKTIRGAGNYSDALTPNSNNNTPNLLSPTSSDLYSSPSFIDEQVCNLASKVNYANQV